jgi:branched-chain amino acid transport system ATP-binding protein
MSGRLDIEGLYTAYDEANVLEGVSLSIEPGRITACSVQWIGQDRDPPTSDQPGRARCITFDGMDITG